MDLKTQPNERRCMAMKETHKLFLPACCPMTQNPLPGSFIEISYTPKDSILEVQSLFDYVASYVGGRGEVRSMEGMIQQIATDCAKAVREYVTVTAFLNLSPHQEMKLECVGNWRPEHAK